MASQEVTQALPRPCGTHRAQLPHVPRGFFDLTLKVLRCVCFACSSLLLTDEDHRDQIANDLGKQQFNGVYASIKARKKCMWCGMCQPNYTRTTLAIRAEWPADTEWQSEEERLYCQQTFTQRDALSILTHITDEDCRIMGFVPNKCHPKHTMLLCVLVPPPVARPAIMASEGSRSRGQDDLTHKLQDINKRSIELALHEGGMARGGGDPGAAGPHP